MRLWAWGHEVVSEDGSQWINREKQRRSAQHLFVNIGLERWRQWMDLWTRRIWECYIYGYSRKYPYDTGQGHNLCHLKAKLKQVQSIIHTLISREICWYSWVTRMILNSPSHNPIFFHSSCHHMVSWWLSKLGCLRCCIQAIHESPCKWTSLDSKSLPKKHYTLLSEPIRDNQTDYLKPMVDGSPLAHDLVWPLTPSVAAD